MGKVWGPDAIFKHSSTSMYGNCVALAESFKDEGLLYVGTDDGLIQVSDDAGKTWRKVEKFPGVPERTYVSKLVASQHDAATVYACFDNHKNGDFAPYAQKSTDAGKTWTSIAGDLPDRHLVWRLVQDHVDPDLLFVGTEFGIFFTVDGGGKWIELTGNMPNIAWRDLAIQTRENDLVGASFGRSFWILDDYTPLRHVSDEALESEALLFPVRKAWWYHERRTLGGGKKASQGDAFYVADNPPFGATFTYDLHDAAKTALEQRREAEKETKSEGGDTPYPGWEAMKEEALEEAPAVLLTVLDATGEVVRRLTGPASAGIHRVAWDLRYPSTDVTTGGYFGDDGDSGFLAPPGTYTVTLALRSKGEARELGSESFEVVPLRQGTLPAAPPAEVVMFLQEVAETNRVISGVRAVLDETGTKLDAIEAATERSLTAEFDTRIDALQRRLYELRDRLSGDQQKARVSELQEHTIGSCLDGFSKQNTGLPFSVECIWTEMLSIFLLTWFITSSTRMNEFVG
jgi:hypothetical protein